jgi:hypothetical protein
MRTYVVTTGLIFVLVLAAHVARLFDEGLHLVTQPTFAFTSLLSVGVSIWAWRLFRSLSTPDGNAQGAPPNGGPATRLGKSGATEGPPSVS